MERTAKGKWNLLVRLYRSTGCRLQEIAHLQGTDVNPYTKTVPGAVAPKGDHLVRNPWVPIWASGQ
jgi:hypothetical protein